jgi:N,N'-diacetylchitobiose transport system substrate-binding protein
MGQGKVASFPGNGWEWPYTLDAKVGNPSLAPVMGAYPMPSHIKGRSMPTFIGGSDLAVPVTSSKKSQAVDWIAAFTASAQMRTIAAAGNIPNSTKLASYTAGNPKVLPFAKAARYGWFVPIAAHWADIENGNVLQDMCSQIFSGRKSVKAATTTASNTITRVLNAG